MTFEAFLVFLLGIVAVTVVIDLLGSILCQLKAIRGMLEREKS